MNIAKLSEMAVSYVPQVAMALITLIIGFWIIGRLSSWIESALHAAKVDETLVPFLVSFVKILLKILLLLSVAAKFGVNTTSFVAILGALMVGIGMALNGTIGHFASGVMLLILKPFKVGDLVSIADGRTGTVEAINAFNTTLRTLDNKKIFITNSNVTDNVITNISGQGTVGLDLTFGIGYGDSIDVARKIILEVGQSCPHIVDVPAQTVVVAELADSSVNLFTRPFCKSENYWDAFFYMQENVKKQFDAQGVSIPFPQMDVHRK